MYDFRERDLIVKKAVVVIDHETGRALDVEVYGERLDGIPGWIQLSLREGDPEIGFRVTEEDHELDPS